jgi:hypothetical protein
MEYDVALNDFVPVGEERKTGFSIPDEGHHRLEEAQSLAIYCGKVI